MCLPHRRGRIGLQGRDTGTWFIKVGFVWGFGSAAGGAGGGAGGGGDADPGYGEQSTGSLQGTVNLNGNPSPGWIYLIPTGPSAQSVISLHSGTVREVIQLRICRQEVIR